MTAEGNTGLTHRVRFNARGWGLFGNGRQRMVQTLVQRTLEGKRINTSVVWGLGLRRSCDSCSSCQATSWRWQEEHHHRLLCC